MSQLRMRRVDLNRLPDLPRLPPGFSLCELQDGELESLAALLRTAFDDESWTPERVHREFVSDPAVKNTFLITWEGVPVATASVQIPDASPEIGYLHWVAADPTHRGKRLGYIVSLAVLHELARHGCRDAALLTDDHRLPAIKTYQNLGFVTEYSDESHHARWEAVAARLSGGRA
jgi:mycothiol synthase